MSVAIQIVDVSRSLVTLKRDTSLITVVELSRRVGSPARSLLGLDARPQKRALSRIQPNTRSRREGSRSAGARRSWTDRERAPRPLPETRRRAYVTDDALRARLGCSADRRAASALTTPSASAGVISSSASLPIVSAITVSSKPAIGGVAGLNAP
jgi:hypothetical protein